VSSYCVLDLGATVDPTLGGALAEVAPPLSATPGKLNFAGGEDGIDMWEVLETTFGSQKERVDTLLRSGGISGARGIR